MRGISPWLNGILDCFTPDVLGRLSSQVNRIHEVNAVENYYQSVVSGLLMPSGNDSRTECPECGGKIVEDEEIDESVCSECGLVLEPAEDNTKNPELNSSVDEWTAFDSTERSDTDAVESTPPETAAEWEMWYPCPECGSLELSQTIESRLAVSATEDGSYGGESSVDEYNYVECSNCGQVLLDEIGED